MPAAAGVCNQKGESFSARQDSPRRRCRPYNDGMQRIMLKAKVHRATVTHADVDYEGSLSLDKTLLDAAGIVPFEAVHVWNVTRGSRLQTYAMVADADSGIVCINGAAAHLAKPGDLVIIATFALVDEADVPRHQPRIVLVDERNRQKLRETIVEIPGPNRRETP